MKFELPFFRSKNSDAAETAPQPDEVRTHLQEMLSTDRSPYTNPHESETTDEQKTPE